MFNGGTMLALDQPSGLFQYWRCGSVEVMASHTQQDLTGVEWPECLLNFSQLLSNTRNGSLLTVFVRDPDVVSALRLIIDNTSCQSAGIEKEGDRFRIRIRK